jgi:hypothetical protein
MLAPSIRPICAICGKVIIEADDSDEHIINRAIGGRRTVRGLLHLACNNGAGRTWDAGLAKQLQPLSLHFDVKRQSGPVPSMPITTTAGEEFVLGPKGQLARRAKPDIKTTPLPGGKKNLLATVGSLPEARQLLEGLKRKNPDIDVETHLAKVKVQRTYPQGAVQLELGFGGELAGRSLVKSALALAHKAGILINDCDDALNYLRRAEGVPCFGYYFVDDLVAGRPAETPLHCIAIEANPATGLILGYAEYFGIHRAVVCLGRGYSGEAVKNVYALDPRTGAELKLSVRLDFGTADVEAIYDYQMDDVAGRQAAFGAVFGPALAAQHQAEWKRVAKEALAYAWANCGASENEMLTEEHKRTISRLFAERVVPFVLHAGGATEESARRRAEAFVDFVIKTAESVA